MRKLPRKNHTYTLKFKRPPPSHWPPIRWVQCPMWYSYAVERFSLLDVAAKVIKEMERRLYERVEEELFGGLGVKR